MIAHKRRKVGIVQLSPTTGDYTAKIRDYLRSIGHHRRVIGSTPVFVRYERGRVAAVGPSAESVTTWGHQ